MCFQSGLQWGLVFEIHLKLTNMQGAHTICQALCKVLDTERERETALAFREYSVELLDSSGLW